MGRRDWTALVEVLGVFVLIMFYIWKWRLFYPWLWIAIFALVVSSHFWRREGAGKLGLRWRECRASLRPVLPWVIALAALLVALGVAFDSISPVVLRRTASSLSVYLVWGLVQQYLLNGYLLNRLSRFTGRAPLAAATLFSTAHLPNWFLMAVSLAGGYVAARVFLRYRSLYVLGLAHGLIGFLFNLVVPDSVSGGFLIGPRYILHQFCAYPEHLLF